MFYFLVAGINFLFYYVIFSPKAFGRLLGSSKLKAFFIFSSVLIVGQIFAFTALKEKNFYEIYNKSRQTFENQDLKESFNSETARIPSKARPNSNSEYGEYILNHAGLRIFYDKYGTDFIELLPNFDQWGPLKYQTIEKNILESLGFYFITVLVAVYFSKKYNSNGMKKWCATLILGCLFLEIGFILERFPREGFLGQYKSNLAYYERIKLYKLLMIIASNAFIAYYAFIKVAKIGRLEKEVSAINSFNKSLPESKEPEFSEIIQEIQESTEKVNNYLEKEKQYKVEQKTSVLPLKVILVISLAFVMVYQYPAVQEYIYNGMKFPNLIAEDYIKL